MRTEHFMFFRLLKTLLNTVRKPSADVRCCLLQTLVHRSSRLRWHLPGSANRRKTLIICLMFPPCPSSFKYNCTALDESASGPPKASASLPKQKEQVHTSEARVKARSSVLPQGFRLPDDLQLPEYQGKDRSESYRKLCGLSYTRLQPLVT